MTGEQLRVELARVAERAPAVDVPDDLFDRGRRAAARIRVIGAAAVVACVALVAGVGWTVVAPAEPPVADDDSRAGVPDHVYAPPDGVVDDLPLMPLDEVGPAAVVYSVDDPDGTVVVVSPDSRYRTIRLPARYSPMLDEVGPVLSPDGRQLVYASQKDHTRGLAVLDLQTGALRYVALAPPPGALVRSLQWSPDSGTVAWSGQLVRSLRDSGASYGRNAAGVIAAGATTSTPLPMVDGSGWDGLGVCDDGSAVRNVRSLLLVSNGGQQHRYRSWREMTADRGACSAPRTILPRPLGPFARLLGWLPDGRGGQPTAVVLSPRWIDASHSSFDGYVLRLIDDRTSRRVGVVESSWVSGVSVATGLMTEDRPTVPAGPDPWPTWWEQHGPLTTGLGAGVALVAVVLGLLVLLRRRRMS